MQVDKLGIPLATSVFHHMTACEEVILGNVVWALKMLAAGSGSVAQQRPRSEEQARAENIHTLFFTVPYKIYTNGYIF